MRVSSAMTIRSQIDGDLRALIRRMSIH